MKCKYKIAIIVIIIIIISICYLTVNSIFKPSFSDESNIDEAIQIVAISVAIFASFIALITALSVLDPKPKQIKSKISVKKVDEIRPYKKDEMSNELKNYFKNHPDKISSYQVHFQITNISGFVLKNLQLQLGFHLKENAPIKIISHPNIQKELSRQTYLAAHKI